MRTLKCCSCGTLVGPLKWQHFSCESLTGPPTPWNGSTGHSWGLLNGGDTAGWHWESPPAPVWVAAPPLRGRPHGPPRLLRGRNRNPKRGRAGAAPSAGRGGGSSPGRRGEAVPGLLPPPSLPPPGPLPAPRRPALRGGGATCRRGGAGAALGRAARPAPQVGRGSSPAGRPLPGRRCRCLRPRPGGGGISRRAARKVEFSRVPFVFAARAR